MASGLQLFAVSVRVLDFTCPTLFPPSPPFPSHTIPSLLLLLYLSYSSTFSLHISTIYSAAHSPPIHLPSLLLTLSPSICPLFSPSRSLPSVLFPNTPFPPSLRPPPPPLSLSFSLSLSRQASPEEKQKMLEMLKRLEEEQSGSDSSDVTSDPTPSLGERLANLNLGMVQKFRC